MPIVSVADLFRNWKMRLLFYGPSGVGKTYLAASAVQVKELCPIYWFGVERGMLSVKEHLETGRVQVVLANGEADLVILQSIITNPGKFKTIVIDSLSELHALIVQAAMGRGSKGTVGGGAFPGRPQYRDAHDKILALLRLIDRTMSAHVLVTASDIPLVDGDSGRVLSLNPDLAGKLSFRTARYFDGLYYLTSKAEASLNPTQPAKVSYALQVVNYGGVPAKDRSPKHAMGTNMDSPTMKKIYEALVGPCTELPLGRVDDPSLTVDGTEVKHVKGTSAPTQPQAKVKAKAEGIRTL